MRLGHRLASKKPVNSYLAAHSLHCILFIMEMRSLSFSNRAVFLDRDGVINAMVYNPEFGLVDSPANPEEFELITGVGKSILTINQMGLLAIVISNQPGVAKGKYTLDLLNAMTEKMYQELAQAGAKLDAVYYCLHHPEAELTQYRQVCECRKPKPGLLLKAVQDWKINLQSSYLVGDGMSDIVTGQVVGVTTLFISSRKAYILDELDRHGVQPDYFVNSLAEAVEIIKSKETV
jgi:D,D-heptose 1,7-bisphosphate phosphatase